MKILRIILVIAVCLFVGSIPLVTVRSAWADTSSVATPVGLSIAELKITGDELVLLQNNTGTDIPNLGIYWLSVFNNVNPLAANVSSSQQQLPAVPLLAGQTLLLSANPAETCGASVAGKLSVSLGDTGGFCKLTKWDYLQMVGLCKHPVTSRVGVVVPTVFCKIFHPTPRIHELCFIAFLMALVMPGSKLTQMPIAAS